MGPAQPVRGVADTSCAPSAATATPRTGPLPTVFVLPRCTDLRVAVPDDTLKNTSVIGRLLEEISWEGASVRGYRLGGRGRDNVLTAEIFLPLGYLPRRAFLGEVLRVAHGADEARAAVIRDIEPAVLTCSPTRQCFPRPALSCSPTPPWFL